MDIVILDSALKHGISEESIMFCIYNYRNDKTLHEPPLKRLFVGFDHLGNAIEVIAIEEEDRNRLVVIHANKLQKKYFYLLEGDN
ncbi:hypothetical protein R84B8_03001 [Treponema sp. R8-4-B8]